MLQECYLQIGEEIVLKVCVGHDCGVLVNPEKYSFEYRSLCRGDEESWLFVEVVRVVVRLGEDEQDEAA